MVMRPPAAPSRLTLEGGTHNMKAPPFDFLQKTFLPLINRMGPQVSVRLERHGFYPAGGGRFTAEIVPCAKLQPLHAVDRGAIALLANIRRHVGDREVETISRLLGWGRELRMVEEVKGSVGPGNVVMIQIGSDPVTEVFTSFGKLGVPAERVAEDVLREARDYLAVRQ
jgi:RNA 3'-terminal phosphate cyclase (ATP)